MHIPYTLHMLNYLYMLIIFVSVSVSGSVSEGYWIPKKMGFTETQSRTMAIETAMKSSAFGFLLAKLHFKSYGARVPSAVSVVWMALVGAILAVVWRFIPVKDEK